MGVRVLSPDQVAYVKTRAKSMKAFAAELGCSRHTVFKAIHDQYAAPKEYVPAPDDGHEWRPVVGFPSYEVSDAGQVRHVFTGSILGAHRTSGDYLQVGLMTSTGRNRSQRLHRVVAIAFIPNPEGKAEVNHKDCDRRNNAAANLEWTTKRENIDHAIISGRYDPTVICPWQKITEADDAIIRADTTTPSSVLAAKYGVTAGHISRIRKGTRPRRRSTRARGIALTSQGGQP